MYLFKNGEPVYEYMPEYGGQKVIIAVDSSKTNTAVIVGDCYGKILDDYELSGKGADIDVYQFCWDMRKALDTLLKGADVVAVGIEDIITKKEAMKGKSGKGYYGHTGLEVHESRKKITAVFDNIVFYFQDRFGITPRMINNQAWKAGTLPPEYRTRDHKKGSKDYFNDIGGRWANRADDVTDAVCIYTYLVGTSNIKPIFEITEIQHSKAEYSVGLFPKSYAVNPNFKEFIIKNNESIEHNIATIANRLEVGQFGYVCIPVESVPLDWIYSSKLKYSASHKYDRNEKELLMIVCRE